ncbi:MAG: 5-bromo-4-chloroindolyl phosphate hydrolysis family protein [Lachnospiraceae bacterium]|nr:5-bromo-4-chloroindolyl phosphate hydrolysis family protein [Lachnospiraceae bacterium]
MNEKDWYDAGARIGDLVQKAIDNEDFSQLSRSIADVVNNAVNEVQASLRNPKPGQGAIHGTWRDESGNAYRNSRQQARRGGRNASPKLAGAQPLVRSPYKGTAPIVLGYSGLAVFGALSLTSLVGGLIGSGLLAALAGGILFAVPAIVCARLAINGRRDRALVQRVQKYMATAGDRDVVTIQELCSAAGCKKEQVLSDLRAVMSSNRVAGQLYLDEEGTTLMRTQEAYRQYVETMKAYQQRRRADRQAAQVTQENLSKFDEETRNILKDGKAFIAHIHEANEMIPGTEITGKLNRLEAVVSRIFAQVEADPSSAPDLHRMMSYYLPITRKLVDAYAQLERQDISGSNVDRTRSEIEASLDTINDAFENLLDSFFEDTAFDISADITTLKTMMARDGLTGQRLYAGEHTASAAKDLTPEAPTLTFGAGAAAAAAPGEEERL